LAYSSILKTKRKKKPLRNQLHGIEEKINKIQERHIQEQDHTEEEKLMVSYEQTMK
jgi:hypothetical protein